MSGTYFEYRISRDCPECANPLVVNGPHLRTKCRACNTQVHLSKDFWKNRFAMSEDGGFFVRGERIGPEPGKKKKPRCDSCEAKLPVDGVETGSEAPFTCPKCGKEQITYPPPKWMEKMGKDKLRPVQIFCGEKEGEDTESDAEDMKPIAFSCVSCGGGLELNLETPRIMECGFCGTRQYLPGSLWHALHPVKRLKSWYVRYE